MAAKSKRINSQIISQLTAALKNANVPVTFYTVKGAKHGGLRDPQVTQLTSAFFAKYLKPERS